MATTAGDIYVRSGATGAFTAVEYVQGGWTTVASSSDMTSIDTTRLADGQIIWVESEEQLYLTRKFVAFETPGYSGTDDSASFSTTNLGISGGGSGDYDGAISSSAQIASLGAEIFSGSLFPFTGSAEITGSLRVDGRITALGEDNVSTTRNNIVFPTKGFGMSVDGYQHISFSKTVGQLSLRGKSSIGAGGSDGVGGVSIANNGGTKVFEYYDSGSNLQRIRMQTGDGGTDLQVEITGALGITGFPNVSASLAEALSGGGSGDITNVIAGLGLSGGAESGEATLTLDTSSTHFINAVNDLAGDGGIFATTGSIQSTTNNLEITGSLEVGGGLFKLTEFTTTPTAEAGAMFYSASNFYFGVE